MRFKCNKCITFIWSLLLAFTSFLPGLIVLILVKPNNGVLDFNDLFIFYLVFFIFLIYINMTSFFFNSSVVEVYDEYFRYQESDLEYSKVFKITYDFGETPRHAKWKSCSINFYDEYGDLCGFTCAFTDNKVLCNEEGIDERPSDCPIISIKESGS